MSGISKFIRMIIFEWSHTTFQNLTKLSKRFHPLTHLSTPPPPITQTFQSPNGYFCKQTLFWTNVYGGPLKGSNKAGNHHIVCFFVLKISSFHCHPPRLLFPLCDLCYFMDGPYVVYWKRRRPRRNRNHHMSILLYWPSQPSKTAFKYVWLPLGLMSMI